MLELVLGSISPRGETRTTFPIHRDLGEFTLQGEIVDRKYFLGVMDPGEGKVHRDCAVRCISGGIPQALVTSDLDASSKFLLLTDEMGNRSRRNTALPVLHKQCRFTGKSLRWMGYIISGRYRRVSPYFPEQVAISENLKNRWFTKSIFRRIVFLDCASRTWQ